MRQNNNILFGLKAHYVSIKKEFLALHTFLVSAFSIPISGILTHTVIKLPGNFSFQLKKLTLHVCNIVSFGTMEFLTLIALLALIGFFLLLAQQF